MLKITVQKQIYTIYFFFLCVFALMLFIIPKLYPSFAIKNRTLDYDQCLYNEDLEGQYSIKVGGLGMIDNKSGNIYDGTFTVNGMNGPAKEVYLYWTVRKASEDASLQLRINGGSIKNINARMSGQVFGPATLSSPKYTYWGYIADLGTAGINNVNNTFRITKDTLGSDMELFGIGVLIIHDDPLVPKQHIEVKCGFDGTFANSLGSVPTLTKWGEWSNVVCHQFPADTNNSRVVNYYAFMSGTKKRTPTIYRPNSFWYITGSSPSIPSSITNLNKPGSVPNQGLEQLTSLSPKTYPDLFDAISGNEWDTIDTGNNIPPDFDIQIPKDHTYICFQTQSRNVDPRSGEYGLGSSMQWSMSALTFAYSSTLPTPTVGPSPTATLTPSTTPTLTPTPIIYYPWVNTIGGNVYSNRFNQTALNNNPIVNTLFDSLNSTTFEGKDRYLSTNLYLQPIGYGLPIKSSETNSQLDAYTDSNSEYKQGISWFSYFDQYFKNSTPTIIKSQITNPNISYTRTSEMHPVANIGDIVVFISSVDVTIDINICDTKSIFLIDGNLTINPNFINEGYDKGCMFIVKGTTTILEGDALTSANPDQSFYDQIHGYFITGLFNTNTDSVGNGLYIKGGIVETDLGTGDMSLNRSLGISRNQYSPSEIIEYDPRFLYIYGDLFTYAYGYNIREGQFIRAQ